MILYSKGNFDFILKSAYYNVVMSKFTYSIKEIEFSVLLLANHVIIFTIQNVTYRLIHIFKTKQAACVN